MIIEVTVISGEGLLVRKKQPVKRNAFVVVRSDPFNHQSTGTDPYGGSYPAWNEKLVLDLPARARYITVEAHSGSRLIGISNIPVSDFAGGFLPENYLSFLSYRLRDANGEKNGIINISVKVKGAAGKVQPAGERVAGGRVFEHGIVTGVPVSYRHENGTCV
ncbi:hypothetical protein ABFX02_02G160000 [Erythranthe guttata]